MTENRENWLYPDASGLYFPHDGFVMRASNGKQYDIDEECELLNEYDKKYNEYRNDVLRLEKEKELIARVLNEELNKSNIPVWKHEYIKDLAHKLGVKL